MKAASSYRQICAPIIARVLQESHGLPESEIAARLFQAYPFESRTGRPRKIWRQEIRAQGGPVLSQGRRFGTVLTPVMAGQPAPSARRWARELGTPITPESWHTPPVRCRTCAHLGATRPVIDCRGVKRIRRQCDCSPCGFTDIDWTACAHYQLRDNPELPQ